jgi:hypothetical protein
LPSIGVFASICSTFLEIARPRNKFLFAQTKTDVRELKTLARAKTPAGKRRDLVLGIDETCELSSELDVLALQNISASVDLSDGNSSEFIGRPSNAPLEAAWLHQGA